MKRIFVAVAASLVGAGLLALAGYGSPVVPKEARRAESGITSAIQASLIAKPEIKAGDIDVSSSQEVVTLIGRVRSERIKDEVGGIARGTWGVKGVHNELLVGTMKY